MLRIFLGAAVAHLQEAPAARDDPASPEAGRIFTYADHRHGAQPDFDAPFHVELWLRESVQVGIRPA